MSSVLHSQLKGVKIILTCRIPVTAWFCSFSNVKQILCLHFGPAFEPEGW